MSCSIKRSSNRLVLSILDFTEIFEEINGSLSLICYDEDSKPYKAPLTGKLAGINTLDALEVKLKEIYKINDTVETNSI